MLKVLFTKDFHDHAHVFLVLISDRCTALESCRLNSPLTFRVKAVRDTIFDSNALIFIVPVVARPDTILVAKSYCGNYGSGKCLLHLLLFV